MVRILFAKLAVAVLLMAMGGGALSARESANWLFGVGFGYGATHTNIKYPDSTKSGGLGVDWIKGTWVDQVNGSIKSWGITYEILVGYKHFLNDYIGFRYYVNVGAQHYKDENFSGGKEKIGVVDYTLNADLLLNFYNSPSISFGIFGGFGVGGAYFDSARIDNYEKFYGGTIDSTRFTEPEFAGVGKVAKNHFSASLSIGTRIVFFQQIRSVGQVVCSAGGDGRRSCSMPISSLEHSLEVGAKFPMLTYYATKKGDIMGAYCVNPVNPANAGKYVCANQRPGYEIKNPYKFTLRYIIAF